MTEWRWQQGGKRDARTRNLSRRRIGDRQLGRYGGGWNTEPWTGRAAIRQIAGRDFRLEGAGFRIARDLD